MVLTVKPATNAVHTSHVEKEPKMESAPLSHAASATGKTAEHFKLYKT